MYITFNDGINKPISIHWNCLKCGAKREYITNVVSNNQPLACRSCGTKFYVEIKLVETK